MDPKFINLPANYLVAVYCLIVLMAFAASARNQQAHYQLPRTNPIENKFENFRLANGVLVLLPPGVNFTESQTRNRTIKLQAEALFSRELETDYYRSNDLDDNEARGSSRESRKVNFMRGLWSKPKISPLYLVNGTVCRFVNSAPICTTLTTTGLMPSATSLALTRSGGFSLDAQFPGSNQQQQQFPNQQQQFGNNQQPQQFPQNQQQQFTNNPQQGANQQQSRPSIG